MSEPTINPCPFCQSTNVGIVGKPSSEIAICNNCGAQSPLWLWGKAVNREKVWGYINEEGDNYENRKSEDS